MSCCTSSNPARTFTKSKKAQGIEATTIVVIIGIVISLLAVAIVFYAPESTCQVRFSSYESVGSKFCSDWSASYFEEEQRPTWNTFTILSDCFKYEGKYDEDKIKKYCENLVAVKAGEDCVAKEPDIDYCKELELFPYSGVD